jgi:hypothetical protein
VIDPYTVVIVGRAVQRVAVEAGPALWTFSTRAVQE